MDKTTEIRNIKLEYKNQIINYNFKYPVISNFTVF